MLLNFDTVEIATEIVVIATECTPGFQQSLSRSDTLLKTCILGLCHGNYGLACSADTGFDKSKTRAGSRPGERVDKGRGADLTVGTRRCGCRCLLQAFRPCDDGQQGNEGSVVRVLH